MLRDVSNWLFENYGEKSTLSKEELSSPEDISYLIKYPREFENRVNWEDVNEIIAAKIAELLKMKTVQAEIAYRNGKRGCLMLHFITQYGADYGEPGASLLAAELDKYEQLQNSKLNSELLIRECFHLIQEFSMFQIIKQEFITMQIFDILIGNQDRHPFNWQVLFKAGAPFFGPLYDNGASLGWQLSEQQLIVMNNSEAQMNKYFKNTKLKVGLIEDTQARIKAKDVLYSCNMLFPEETFNTLQLLEEMDLKGYNQFIDDMPLISKVRKEFLKEFISFRRDKLIYIIKEDGDSIGIY